MFFAQKPEQKQDVMVDVDHKQVELRLRQKDLQSNEDQSNDFHQQKKPPEKSVGNGACWENFDFGCIVEHFREAIVGINQGCEKGGSVSS